MKEEFEELRKNCELGNINLIRINLNSHIFSKKDIDTLIRHCIYRYDALKKHYSESIRELLKHADLNFVNSKYDNSTLMMTACSKGNIMIIKELLNATNNENQHIIVDLSLNDINKFNFIHHILYKNTNETDAIEILNFILNFNDKYKPIIQIALLGEDIKGNTPLTLILLKGWYQMLIKYLELTEYKQYINKGSQNNILHCSITGKNLNCLKLMLYYSTIEDIKAKNFEGDTPSDLAKRKKYYSFVKRIDHHEEMLTNKDVKIDKSLLLKHYIDSNEIMNMYQEYKFNEALTLLTEYKLNKSIIGDIENLSLEWNNLLTKYQISNGCLSPTNKNINSKSKVLTKEKILSKYLDNNASLYSASVSQTKQTTLIDLITFLSEHTSPMKIMDHINEESYPIDLLIYNKGIVSLSLGDTYSGLRTLSLYLIHILLQNKDDYYKWIMYVNITFIIIENLIKMNQIHIASLIISSFEEFLFTTFKQTKKIIYSKSIESIFDHLSNSEIINQNSPTWDESFCYINLLKSLCDINNGKKYIIEYKKLINNCNYCNEMKIFSRLYATYICIKIKMNYLKNHSSKCFKKLFVIKELYFNESQEHQLFYYNSIGIVNLKLKNYVVAEYYFKKGIITYTDLIHLNKGKRYLDLNLRGAHLCYMKFNLALSLFYQKKYKQAQKIFRELTQVNIINKNVYLWYRLGLSTLEIYLSERKSAKDKSFNDIIKKSVGYSTKRKDTIEDKDNNLKKVIIGNDKKQFYNNKTYQQLKLEEEENSIDELYAQFEKEYGNLNIEKRYSEVGINIIENKRIVLSAQKSNKPDHINLQNKRELQDAINVFKQTILLMKDGGQNNQIIKDIYNFYTKKREDCFIEKGLNQNIFITTYFNLLLSFSLNENWLEILYTVKYLYSKHKILSNDIKLKLSNYQIEALIGLHRHKEAINCLKDNLHACQQDNFRFDYINKPTGMLLNDVLFKITLNFNLVRVNIMNQNITEAKKIMKNTIAMFYKGKTDEVPGFAINMILFLYLSEGKNNTQKIIKLIKSRNLDFSKWDS